MPAKESTCSPEFNDTIRTCKPGDIIRFGAYDWFVYAKENNIVSLLCKDSVKTGTYHSANIPMTWEKCDLRKWLNDEFYSSFTPEERALIVKTHLKNSRYFPNLTSGGRPTDDYVFLLSIQEAKKIDQSILRFDTKWWLRSPGYEQNRAADVFNDGLVDRKGCLLLHQFHGVRPALNIAVKEIGTY